MRFAFAVFVGRLVRRLVRLVRPGGGSALPGLWVSKIAPGLLESMWNSFDEGVVVITGSAGKSSTTKMLVAILESHGKSVFTNPTTANIRQGFFATILERCDWRGRVMGDIAVLEVDEGHAAEILSVETAKFVTVLNVTDDQLDRFVDPMLVRQKLLKAALSASDGVVLNGDDQNLLILAAEAGSALAKPSYFGFEPNLIASKFLGFANTYVEALPKPEFNTKVVGLVKNEVSVEVDGQKCEFTLKNRGIHYAADAAAALETARRILGSNFSAVVAGTTIQNLAPVFARGEITRIHDQEVELVLVQNPASFQLNLDALKGQLENVMVAIGRDVHDASWLWTVDYSSLSKVDVVTGFNAFEMALCFAYNDVAVGETTEDLEQALSKFLELCKGSTVRPVVLLSADAMRRYRRMLGFVTPSMVGIE